MLEGLELPRNDMLRFGRMVAECDEDGLSKCCPLVSVANTECVLYVLIGDCAACSTGGLRAHSYAADSIRRGDRPAMLVDNSSASTTIPILHYSTPPILSRVVLAS